MGSNLAFFLSLGESVGGVLSPILFAICIDRLLQELAVSGVYCYRDNLSVGALAYADDVTLLAPSPSALRSFVSS